MPLTPSASKPNAYARSVSKRFAACMPSGSAALGVGCISVSIMTLMPLPTSLYSAAQVRALDAYAIEALGVPGYTLMKRAGEAALRYLRSRWPTAHRIVIVCGGGNNGGDGYVLARFAQAAGLTVTVLVAVPPETLGGEARQAYNERVGGCGPGQRRS